jgi:hypothetical protein
MMNMNRHQTGWIDMARVFDQGAEKMEQDDGIHTAAECHPPSGGIDQRLTLLLNIIRQQLIHSSTD